MPCAAGEVCSAGVCGLMCIASQTICGGECVDPTTSNQYCHAAGACGTPCASGFVCRGGACTCPTNEVSCGGVCVNPSTNDQYCNTSLACGSNPCVGGETCVGGVCTCPTGEVFCGGACIDPTTSNKYCNTALACGSACATGQACVAGLCTCSAGFTNCGTFPAVVCVDESYDPNNCGACGNVCPQDPNSEGTPVCNDNLPGCTTDAGPASPNCGCSLTCNQGYFLVEQSPATADAGETLECLPGCTDTDGEGPNVTVYPGTTEIDFSDYEEFPAGTTIQLGSQPGVYYTLSAEIEGYEGALNTPYSGPVPDGSTSVSTTWFVVIPPNSADPFNPYCESCVPGSSPGTTVLNNGCGDDEGS